MSPEFQPYIHNSVCLCVRPSSHFSTIDVLPFFSPLRSSSSPLTKIFSQNIFLFVFLLLCRPNISPSQNIFLLSLFSSADQKFGSLILKAHRYFQVKHICCTKKQHIVHALASTNVDWKIGLLVASLPPQLFWIDLNCVEGEILPPGTLSEKRQNICITTCVSGCVQ